MTLVLIGGPSGVGKSRLAHQVALITQSSVAQIDDMQGALETLVPEDRLPEFYDHRNAYRRTKRPEVIAEAIWNISTFFGPAIERAIDNRIESGTSTVFEGDFIAPELAAKVRSKGVKSIFLIDDESSFRANFLEREGDEQPFRASISSLHSERIRTSCTELGLPLVEARPFETLAVRACSLLEIEGSSVPQAVNCPALTAD